MKFYLLVLIVILSFTTRLYSQVTIGSDIPPADGALLDMKQNPDGSSKLGLGLSRVEIKDLDVLKIGESDYSGQEREHVGLMVYNIYEDYCVDPIHYKGIYVWDGNSWQRAQIGENLENGVYEVIDARDGEVYFARNFGNVAGDWMLQSLRYVPNPVDGYSGYEHKPSPVGKNKYFAYPAQNAVYNPADHPKSDWRKEYGLLYTWHAATNDENTSTSNQAQGADGSDPVATSIRGLCPLGWHIPSDKEWNDLEREIYTNPIPYSKYNATEAVFSPVWNPSWETGGGRGSSPNNATNPGHGHAMANACRLEGSDYESNGKSKPTKQGGFDIFLVGEISSGSSRSYGRLNYLWTSSSGSSPNYAWFRNFEYNRSAVTRLNYPRTNMFSVRCKKDGN